MQFTAMDVEPYLGSFVIRAKALDQAPKPRGMIHLDEVRDFVRREIVEHETRRQDEPPRI
jgi:hypothetical protein